MTNDYDMTSQAAWDTTSGFQLTSNPNAVPRDPGLWVVRSLAAFLRAAPVEGALTLHDNNRVGSAHGPRPLVHQGVQLRNTKAGWWPACHPKLGHF